jgi:hypothetical protein
MMGNDRSDVREMSHSVESERAIFGVSMMGDLSKSSK